MTPSTKEQKLERLAKIEEEAEELRKLLEEPETPKEPKLAPENFGIYRTRGGFTVFVIEEDTDNQPFRAFSVTDPTDNMWLYTDGRPNSLMFEGWELVEKLGKLAGSRDDAKEHLSIHSERGVKYGPCLPYKLATIKGSLG